MNRYAIVALLCLGLTGCEPAASPQEHSKDSTVLDRSSSFIDLGWHSLYLSDCNDSHADLDVIMYPNGNTAYVYQVTVDTNETRNIVNPGTTEKLATATYLGHCNLRIDKVQ